MGKTVASASTRSKLDAVARWRDSAKRMAELAKSGNLPDDALEQSEDRDTANWNPFCNLQDSLPEGVMGKVGKWSQKEMREVS